MSQRRDRPLQRLVRRRAVVLGNLPDSSRSPPLPAPSFADLSRSPSQALIAAASGTVSDAQSHADLRCCPVRTLRYGHLPSRLSVELTISLQSLQQYPSEGLPGHGKPGPSDSAGLAATVIRTRPGAWKSGGAGWWIRRYRNAARLLLLSGRGGYEHRRRRDSERGCRPLSYSLHGGPEAPGSCGCRSRPPACGWQTNGVACAA